MADEKKRVSQFPARRSMVGDAVKLAIANKPTVGGSQGAYVRPPCGTCLSWRRDARAGTQGVPLTAGQCMFGPPIPHPLGFTESMQIAGVVVIRPPMASDSEGCDQHDDGTDDDGEDHGGEPVSLHEKAG